MRLGLIAIEEAFHTRLGLHERLSGEHSFLEGNSPSSFLWYFLYVHIKEKILSFIFVFFVFLIHYENSLLYFWFFFEFRFAIKQMPVDECELQGHQVAGSTQFRVSSSVVCWPEYGWL
jgi:hypothetical protein